MGNAERSTGLLTAVAMTAAMLMIAHHIAGKATRDALFLTSFDIAALPKIMIASAAVSVAAVLLMSRLLARFGPARLIPPLYFASGGLLAVQWSLATTLPEVAAIALYLHVSAINAILISGFWSLINERFDPYAAKKVITRLTAATTFGGVAGGVAAKTVATMADTHDILLMLAIIHVVCGIAVGFLARGQTTDGRRPDEPPTRLLAPLKRSALIRRMALLGLLVATTAAVLDYLLKAQASASLSDEDLISFFSYFYMAVGLGTFFVQLAVGNKALRWLGLGGSMAAWPIAILLTGSAALFVRSLITVTLMRASANLLYNSFFRAGFELLYTPIAPADKRSGKVLIDVGADRAGDMAGGLLIMLILLLPAAGDSILFVTALLLAALCLVLILVLHRSYVRQLADNLRHGRQTADDIEVVDATTSATIASTQATIDRDQLLREVAALQAARGQPGDRDTLDAVAGSRDPTVDAILDLRSDDGDRIRRVLNGQPVNAALLPHAIQLLRDERVLPDLMRALRKVATTHAGQCVDALSDPMQHPLVRRRLPLILGASESPLAVHGLVTGLDDPDWNVRFRCARGLEALRRRQPHTTLDSDRLLRRAEREIKTLLADGGHRGQPLELVFLLFGAAYEPEPMALCWHALQEDDRHLRGTALEYLENLLPPEVWSQLQRLIAPGHVAGRKKRSLQQATQSLRAAAASLKPTKKPDSDATAADLLD